MLGQLYFSKVSLIGPTHIRLSQIHLCPILFIKKNAQLKVEKIILNVGLKLRRLEIENCQFLLLTYSHEGLQLLKSCQDFENESLQLENDGS